MIELYLTRHGETLENAQHILQGHMPGHLSPLGLEQARQLRDSLAHTRFDHIIVSDLQRAVDTAQIVNEPHGLPLVTTPLLRERDWGEFTGVYIRDVQAHLVSDFPSSVENAAQLSQRARQFLQFLLDSYNGQTVLAVGHGYFDRCIVAEVENKVPHDVPRWGNAEVRHIRLYSPEDNLGQVTDDTEVSAD